MTEFVAKLLIQQTAAQVHHGKSADVTFSLLVIQIHIAPDCTR